jgi:hypothetical protein
MSRVWGTAKGPARDNMDRAELEKREILLQCYFTHDSYAVVGESPGAGGRRIFQVQLTRGKATRTPAVYTIQGPNGRWYVENLEMAAVRDFCTEANARR